MHSHDRTLLSKLGFADPDKKDHRHDLACQYLAQGEIAMRLVDIATRKEEGRQQWAVLKTLPEYHIAKGDGQYKTTIGFADLCIVFTSLASTPDRPLEDLRGRAVAESLKLWAEYQKRPVYMRQSNESNTLWRDRLKEDGLQGYDQAYKEMQERHRKECDQIDKDVSASVAAQAHRQIAIPAQWQPLSNGDWKDAVTGAGYHTRGGSLLVEVKVNPIPTCDALRQLGLYRTYLQISAVMLVTAFDLSVEDVEMLKGEKVHHIRLGAAFDAYCQRRKEQPQMAASLEI